MSPLDGQIPIPNSTNTPNTHFSPHHLLPTMFSSIVAGTSKNTIKVNKHGKQTATCSHQALGETPFIFNEAGHVVSVLFAVPHVSMLMCSCRRLAMRRNGTRQPKRSSTGLVSTTVLTPLRTFTPVTSSLWWVVSVVVSFIILTWLLTLQGSSKGASLIARLQRR
jgi:hypothetical protein